jgi:hypothetical protein
VTRAIVRLRDTDYLASPDDRGAVELTDLLPGRYVVTVIDSAMARLGMAVGTPARIVIDRDSVVTQRLVTKTITDYVGPSCMGNHERGAIEGQVVTPAGAPALDARWELGEDMGTTSEAIAVTGRVHDDGRFALCPALPAERARVLQLRVWRESAPQRVEVYSLLGRRSTIRVVLPP